MTLGGDYYSFLSLISALNTFLVMEKYLLYAINHVYVWQVSLQLSCGPTYKRDILYGTRHLVISKYRKINGTV